MVNKIASTFKQNRRSIATEKYPLRHFLSSEIWLTLLMLGYGGLGWALWFDRSFSAIGVMTFILAIAGVRLCMLAGLSDWMGLWSFTLGCAFILFGTFISTGLFSWAIITALAWIGIFTLDLALSHSVEHLLATGLSKTQVFFLLAIVCATGAMVGWVLPIHFFS